MGEKKTITHGVFDSFSGLAAELPRGRRTPENVLSALRRNPRLSTRDMGAHPWLCDCIEALKRDGRIDEDKDEPYPWHLYIVQPQKEASNG